MIFVKWTVVFATLLIVFQIKREVVSFTRVTCLICHCHMFFSVFTSLYLIVIIILI